MKALTTTALFLLALNTACGSLPETEMETAASTEAKSDDADMLDSPIRIQGYISPAFDVVVDGKRYGDSEDFYTEKLVALKAEAKKAGYEGWTLSFDAAIGLDDLADDMKVFIAATGNKGYAAETYLDYDGRFSFQIPVADQKYQYNLRANKRIGLKLTPPVDQETGVQGQSVSWCYNFSAELRSFDADGESVILNQFTTKLTQYKCQGDAENGGIHIP